MAESNKMYKMKLTYRNVNGYLIPNINYKSGEQRKSKVRRESWKCGLRLFLCLKGSDKFEYLSDGQSGYRTEYWDVRLSGTLSY